MTGDLRLGPVRDHTLSPGPAPPRFAPASGSPCRCWSGYQLSVLDYRGVGSRVLAHVFMLGLEWTY